MMTGGPTHPKILDLASRLGVPRYVAVGVMETFWHWVGAYAPTGSLANRSPAAIAVGIGWDGDAAALIEALRGARLLDCVRNGAGSFLAVHNWHIRCEKWVRMRLKRGGQTFWNGAPPFPKRGEHPQPQPPVELKEGADGEERRDEKRARRDRKSERRDETGSRRDGKASRRSQKRQSGALPESGTGIRKPMPESGTGNPEPETTPAPKPETGTGAEDGAEAETAPGSAPGAKAAAQPSAAAGTTARPNPAGPGDSGSGPGSGGGAIEAVLADLRERILAYRSDAPQRGPARDTVKQADGLAKLLIRAFGVPNPGVLPKGEERSRAGSDRTDLAMNVAPRLLAALSDDPDLGDWIDRQVREVRTAAKPVAAFKHRLRERGIIPAKGAGS